MAEGGLTPPSILPSLRKSDRRIFHTKASLQKLSAKVGGAGVGRVPTWGTWGTITSLAAHVPTVLSATGRALEAAGGGAERVQLRPGVCLCPPGALPACGAARSHAGRRCPDPPFPFPSFPQGASPHCQRGGSHWHRVRAGCPGGSGTLQWGHVAMLGGSLCFPQALDGDLYERLREHLSAASRTEVETCRATRDWFQGVVEASARVTALSPELGGTQGHR